jgi:molecular chaperone DnaK
MKLGEAMYKSQQSEGGDGDGGDAGGTSASGDDVVDAEFEEVDDEKKKSA